MQTGSYSQDCVMRGDVVLAEGVLRDACIVIRNGVIQDVATCHSGTVTHDYSGCLIAPGYIDVHIHAISKADTMDGSPESLCRMAKALFRHGVTGFLPTTVTHSTSSTLAAIRAVQDVMAQSVGHVEAQVLGMHLEGPWISPDAKGAQNGDYIVEPHSERIAALLREAGDVVKIVTIAPELAGFQAAMKEFHNRGIAVSIGHTTASYDEAVWAMEQGARRVTHCFNAMTGLHHRNPGVVGAALLRADVYTELIADGHHVHPAVMEIMVRMKGHERIILVSDSMEAADMPDGDDYHIGGLRVTVKDGQARLDNGSLAGSVLTLDVAVQNMVNLCGVPVHEAVAMASASPAESIGLGHRKGRIEPGYDADLVVLSRDLSPVHTFCSGLR